jgi:hypothetical protein
MGRVARLAAGVAISALVLCAGSPPLGAWPLEGPASEGRPASQGRRAFLKLFLKRAGAVIVAPLVPALSQASSHPHWPQKGFLVSAGELSDYVATCSPGAARAQGWEVVVEDAFDGLRIFSPDASFNPLRPAGAPLCRVFARILLVRADELEHSPVLGAATRGTRFAALGSLSRMPIVTLGQHSLSPLGALLGRGRAEIEQALREGKAPSELRTAQAVAGIQKREDVALSLGNWVAMVNLDWLLEAAEALRAPGADALLTRGLLADGLFGPVLTMIEQRPATPPATSPAAWQQVAGNPHAGPQSLGRHAALLELARQRFGADPAGLDRTARKVERFLQARGAKGWPLGLHFLREQPFWPGAAEELALSDDNMLFLPGDLFPAGRAAPSPEDDE